MKKKRLFLIPLCLLLLAAAWFLLRSRIPQRWYTADELGIPQLQSPLDADGDGVDDWTDMVLGARAYIGTHPHYKSKYYAGGYPDDGLGVWHRRDLAGLPGGGLFPEGPGGPGHRRPSRLLSQHRNP